MKLDGLYDMIGYKKPTHQEKMDEQGMRKAMSQNRSLGRRNIEMFKENENCFLKCPRYNPCPICDKCLSKASHLYVKCQRCEIPICTHTHKDRVTMIKRKNFKVTMYKEMLDELREKEKNG